MKTASGALLELAAAAATNDDCAIRTRIRFEGVGVEVRAEPRRTLRRRDGDRHAVDEDGGYDDGNDDDDEDEYEDKEVETTRKRGRR